MGKIFNEAQFLAATSAIRDFDAPNASLLDSLRANPRRLTKLMAEIAQTETYLQRLDSVLDATLSPAYMFTLNDPQIVGEMIVFKLEQESRIPLNSIRPFYGSGVYAIYYHGNFPAYEAISGTNCPIYVGKAGPKEATAGSPKTQGTSLYGRLNEHRNKSIEKANNLNVIDFSCRYMVVQSGLEKAAEDFLINRYRPVWNEESQVCSGLGKHGDKARAEKSSWDVLHPGRPWAEGQLSRSGETPKIVTTNIQACFEKLYTIKPDYWISIFNSAWISKRSAN